MTNTPLDTAHIAMDANPDDDTVRLQFYYEFFGLIQHHFETVGDGARSSHLKNCLSEVVLLKQCFVVVC